jgi:hypothetical protein
MLSADTRAPRPLCRDLDGDCFELAFCEARRCSVELRRGLVGELGHCPISGVRAVAQYPTERFQRRYRHS